MARFNRRGALGLMGHCTGLVLAGSTSALRAQAPPRVFLPPTGPVQFTRVLVRDLADAAALTVTRQWQIRFVPMGRGFRVEGEQVGVEVAAPAGLERLTQIERERVEHTVFPLSLSTAGRILGGGSEASPEPVVEATRLALARMAQTGIKPPDITDARHFLAGLQASAVESLAKIPEDLFFPELSSWEIDQTLDLPGSENGAIVVRFMATLDAAGQCLSLGQREITTTFGDIARKTTERWTLEPLANSV